MYHKNGLEPVLRHQMLIAFKGTPEKNNMANERIA